MIGFNNKKIGFIVDSSSNIAPGQFEDVEVVPLQVIVGSNTTYKDGINFFQKDLKDKLDNNFDVKTSQAAMPDMMMAAEKMCSQYDQVFVFPIHNKLSGNVNTWRILKDEFPNLEIVMTYDIGLSFAWTIEEVKQYLGAVEANEQKVQEFINTKIAPNRVGWLMVRDLSQLVKGGRVNGLKAAFAKLFGIKPVILFDTNGLTNFDKVKSNESFFSVCDEHLHHHYAAKDIKRALLFVPEGSDLKSEFINDWLKHYASIPHEIVSFPSVVLSHTGIEAVAQYLELK